MEISIARSISRFNNFEISNTEIPGFSFAKSSIVNIKEELKGSKNLTFEPEFSSYFNKSSYLW